MLMFRMTGWQRRSCAVQMAKANQIQPHPKLPSWLSWKSWRTNTATFRL